MEDNFKLTKEEIDEIIVISSNLNTYITAELIMLEKKAEESDIYEITKMKKEKYVNLRNWWKKIDKKYSLIYSDKYKYDIDTLNGTLVKIMNEK